MKEGVVPVRDAADERDSTVPVNVQQIKSLLLCCNAASYGGIWGNKRSVSVQWVELLLIFERKDTAFIWTGLFSLS